MKTVLFLETSSCRGGSFESLCQHIEHIDRTRTRPVLACLNEPLDPERVAALNVPYHHVKDTRYSYTKRIRGGGHPLVDMLEWFVLRICPLLHLVVLRAIHARARRQLVKIIRNERVDVVHLNVQIQRDMCGVFAAEEAGVKCVSHLRSIRGTLGRKVMAYANGVVDAYIANSAVTKKHWLGVGVEESKVHLVLNAVTPVEVDALDLRGEWNLGADTRTVIGCISPLHKEKGQEYLLRAFKAYLQIEKDAWLFLVGNGPHEEFLHGYAKELGVASRVLFTGRVNNAKEMCAGFDVSVCPSVYDSFGRVVLESMQVGTPLIATDVGGIRQIVKHRENGMLVPYDDEEAFVEAVSEITTTSEFRDRLIRAGRETIEDAFSIHRYAREVEEIYEEVSGESE